MDPLDAFPDFALLVSVVEHGSLSAAGRALALPKATISRRLAALERRLGAPLLHRSTRALTPTDFGRRVLERAGPIIREAAAAQAELLTGGTVPSGLVRVTAPTAYGQAVLAPRIMAFLARHPAVRVDLRLEDARARLVPEGVDLAIRMGPLDDSEHVARRIGTVAMRLVAAPAYLSARGTPATPADLAAHEAVLTRPDLNHWRLGAVEVRPAWRLSTGNMALTCDAALGGLGIALLPEFLAAIPLAEGRLIELLPGFPPPAVDVTALRPGGAAPSAAVAMLLRHLGGGPA